MSDSDNDSDSNIPPLKVCEERCKEFASVTGTNSALAMFYLQDRDWDLQRALNAYFADSAHSGGSAPKGASATSTTASAQPANVTKVVHPEPHRIRLLSWNIDGLDQENIETRAKSVAQTINKEKPDVVYLQEVVPTNQDILEEMCPTYEFFGGATRGYYVAMMFNTNSVIAEEAEYMPFESSRMGRGMLSAKVKIKGIPANLFTSHFESTKDHAAERKNQLKKALEKMAAADPEATVILGGDLNLRDYELVEVGGLPDGMLDIWEATGRRPEAKFTWDTTRNDNLYWSFKFHPRCRFDRIFLRHPKEGGNKLKPVYFELVGIKRIPACKRFPSDHWGLLTHYDKI